MKKIRKKIGITVSILLVIIGSVYAENGTVPPNLPIEDAPNISIGDINGSSAKEDIALEEGVVYKENITGTFGEEGGITEKKSIPGFGFIVTVIMFLSVVIITRRR